MTRFIWTSIVCSLLSLGSFGVLMLEDRRLGAALPYSVPAAFAAVLALTPILVAIANRVPARPAPVAAPVAETASEPVAAAPPSLPPVRRAVPQGVVLLDFSSAANRRRAA